MIGHPMRRRILILYGSETGQAEAISHQILDQCRHHLEVLLDNFNITVDRFCLDKTEQRFSLEREETIIFVVSTTGEGDPPQNALKFWRRYRKRTLEKTLLSHLWYTLLGLGDSNYERFASFGRDLDKRLQELGAKKFYGTGFGDDAVGLEVGVEPWIEDLFPAILNHFNAYSTINIPIIEVKMLSSNETQIGLKDNCPIMESKESLCQLSQLTLPLISSKFQSFKIAIHESLPEEYFKEYEENGKKEFFFQSLPVMDSKIFDSSIVEMKTLTNNKESKDDNKIIIETTFQVENEEYIGYESGDSFGFIIGNCDEEVNQLLKSLDLMDKRDYYCEVLTPEVFPHLPKISRIFDLFKYYLEIRFIPKMSGLRHFADFCDNPLQRRRLLELCSREGAEDYNKFVRNDLISVLDIFQIFDSCRPPLEVILANTQCFRPRYYSVCNAPNPQNRKQFKIAFSVITFEKKNLRKDTQLFGVFTGTLLRLSEQTNEDIVANRLAKLSLESNIQSIKAFKRKNLYFKLPSNLSTPIIMVGPGTGVAPFIGFLQQRQMMASRSPVPLGETWLFFGCRHSNIDYIYEKPLKQFLSDKVLTQLCVCFSREIVDELSPKYVQDLIQKHSKAIFKLIDTKKAVVYVCGDVKGMAVNVFNAFVKIVEECDQQTHENAVKYVRDLQSEKRYLQDVWN